MTLTRKSLQQIKNSCLYVYKKKLTHHTSFKLFFSVVVEPVGDLWGSARLRLRRLCRRSLPAAALKDVSWRWGGPTSSWPHRPAWQASFTKASLRLMLMLWSCTFISGELLLRFWEWNGSKDGTAGKFCTTCSSDLWFEQMISENQHQK